MKTKTVAIEREDTGMYDMPMIKDTGTSMAIVNRVTGEQIAEYKYTHSVTGHDADRAAIRRTIRHHLNRCGTIGNYQW